MRPDESSLSRRRRWWPGLFLLGLSAMSLALFARSPLGDYSASPQYADGHFRNGTEKPDSVPEPGAKVMLDFFFNKPDDTEPPAPIPIRALTRAVLDAAHDRSLWRLGHSTILMKLRGHWWLTDPVFSERASPVQWAGPKRFHAPPISIEELPSIRGVLLSHDHYDHLDQTAVVALAAKTEVFLAPLGVGDRLVDWGVPAAKVQQFDWWQGTEIEGLKLTATPAQHFSGRGLGDRDRTLWASWVIKDEALRVFFSGDTGYFDGFAEIGRRFGPFALTLMETGAYNAKSWPWIHMQPSETVQAHRDLGGAWLLPIHNGTFDLALHAWDDPFERVLEAAAAEGVNVATPMMGERVDLNAPQSGERWWRAVKAP